MMQSDTVNAFLAAMASPDVTVRQEAMKHLPEQEPAAALPGLADLMGNADPAVAKAAKAAMENLAHRVQAPPPGKDRANGSAARTRVADALVEIARSSRPRMVRAHALYLIGFTGDSTQEKALSPLEKDAEVGEDARMARQRIRSVRY